MERLPSGWPLNVFSGEKPRAFEGAPEFIWLLRAMKGSQVLLKSTHCAVMRPAALLSFEAYILPRHIQSPPRGSQFEEPEFAHYSLRHMTGLSANAESRPRLRLRIGTNVHVEVGRNYAIAMSWTLLDLSP